MRTKNVWHQPISNGQLKDSAVPNNWWQRVDQKARQVIHIAQTQSNEQIAHKKEREENTSAQQKIDQGTILS